jgi:hypothetical protein
MDLPSSLLNSELIKEKSVFYFTSSKINTKVPHNFIVIKNIDDSIIVFSCCTSQYQTICRYVSFNNYSEDTIASIDYNSYSFLKKPTYINCNSKIEYDYTEFTSLYQTGKINYRGEISDEEYDKIVNGIILSEDIEEELKDHLR